MKTKIYLDTNFLLIPPKFKVDIFEEIDRLASFDYELVILDRTLEELSRIVDMQRGKDKKAASIAVQLVRKKFEDGSLSIEKARSDGNVDSNLIGLAKQSRIIVATQDKELKRHLIQEGARIIDLRKQQYLIISE